MKTGKIDPQNTNGSINILVYYAMVGIASVLILKTQELIVDEVFHVTQAQRFCNNIFVYDDKITTPPGPYLMSWALSVLWNECSLGFLRFTNIIYGILLPWVLKGLVGDWEAAIEQSLFPTSFFFHFLYYTDSGSVFWVLISFLAAKNGKFTLAACCSFIAMWYRQTNVVWMMLIMGLSIVYIREGEKLGEGVKQGSFALGRLRSTRLSGTLANEIQDFLVFLTVNWSMLLKKLSGFVLNGILFGLFLYWNNGIVIGDKLNHVVAVHVPQIYYFAVFSVFFSWDFDLVLNALTRLRLIHILLMMVMGWTILKYT